ncbi:NAD-dependent dihydropyrimidine dehydrogenase subunit PreA [Butyrivibrio sp. YAB3001]|uniref:NAD-dependent dihydropyrimidine dehydrogenase subunit PreA n=1 Tax=Butyrivibrio sp. YAB3001 TaxID=1520812 RepID=UPI0008F64724|nr:NAD-dependent dihydropyrimidine dehydrogenase subunit PreA [Butyrivibrio sp. YAB3001]SFD06169.1 dihydropyrimidine dehydrogenase (NAD+) subunit PreA [Butyrivibrio sp. YAB3001]
MLLKNMIKRSDMISCCLCKDAPCSDACPFINTVKVLRHVWFDNEDIAALELDDNPCINCDGQCEDACVKKGKVHIKGIIEKLINEVRPKAEIDIPVDYSRLKCDICGIEIENPFLLSSSVVASTYDMCARAFEAGWAGACFKTICSFDIHEASPRFSAITGDNGSIVGFKNIEQLSDHSVAENMEIFRRLKEKYPSKFILASIMGQYEEEWENLARLCEENGADAIELNFSCPNMQEDGLGSDIGQIPELVEKYTRAAKRGTKIPVIAKLTPNVASMSPAAEAAISGGADGIAAINTIKSVMGVNPFSYVSAPAVKGKSAIGGYSGLAVKPIALRFISELGQNTKMKGKHISGMGGIETWRDSLEFILMGSGSIQITTAVMQYGYRIIDDLKDGLNYYLAQMGIGSVKDIIGAGLDSVSETTDVLDRDSVLFPKFDIVRCIGCGRCVISCDDGGHQAIRFENRIPKLDGSRCVGCHLCMLVCPCDAIYPAEKRIQR